MSHHDSENNELRGTAETPQVFLAGIFRRIADINEDLQDFSYRTSDDESPVQKVLMQPQVRGLLLTIHCIFPELLLPALTLLDRDLVKPGPLSMRTRSEDKRGPLNRPETEFLPVYYAGAASSFASSSADRKKHIAHFSDCNSYYEVRLGSWNCSCPLFTLEALSRVSPGYIDTHSQLQDARQASGIESQCRSLPICKHILACAILVSCHSVRLDSMNNASGMNQAAAWSAGWKT